MLHLRKGKVESIWDTETINTYAASVSEGMQASLPPNAMPSMPPSAETDEVLESHEEMSAASEEGGAGDLQAGQQSWLRIKTERKAKEEEAKIKGQRVFREIRMRCYGNCCNVQYGETKSSYCVEQGATSDQGALPTYSH